MDISNSQFPGSSLGIVKKRRNRHACDPCRRKRAKCDGNLPCHGCIVSEATCTYTTPKKRGVPTGFLQKLETSNEKLISLVALIIDNLDDGYDIVSSIANTIAQESPGATRERYTQSRAHILGLLDVEDFEEMPARNGKCKKNANTNNNDSDETEVARFVDDKKQQQIQAATSSSSNATTNVNTPSQPKLNRSEQSQSSIPSVSSDNGSIVPLDDDSIVVKSEDVPIPVEPDAPDNPAAASSEVRFLGPSSGFDESFYASFERLRLTQARFDVSAWKSIISSYSVMDLLDTYFAYVHPLFPMVEKSKLVQLMYSSDATKKNGANCLLWSTIMMGLNLTNVGTHKQDSYKSRIMHDLTICTLDCKYSLESVQAMLIQGFYFYGKGHWSNSYLIVGNAVRMANVIGLHIGESDTVSRRTWKCCCIIDTLISGRLGRESLISIDNFFVQPEPETGEEWELWKQPSQDYVKSPSSTTDGGDRTSPPSQNAEPARTLSIFNQFYELMKLINLLISETNSPRYSSYTPQERKSLLSRVSCQLDEWAMNLPVHCSFIEYTDPSTSSGSQLLPHKANLLLCFFAFTANLHIMDNNDTLRNCKNILLPETVVNFTSNVCGCYFGRYSASKTLPTFEYFISLSLSLFVKTLLQSEKQSLDQMTDRDEFVSLLTYLEEICIPWQGATMSFKYFTKLATSNILSTNYANTNTSSNHAGNNNNNNSNNDNLNNNPNNLFNPLAQSNDQFTVSPFASSLMDTPLDSMSDFPDIDSFELLQQTLMPSGFQYDQRQYGSY